MLVSYFIGLFLATVYGPILFVAGYVAGKWREPRPLPRLTQKLLDHQEVAMWSQLFFGLAIAVACVTRRGDDTLQGYEGAIIRCVVIINAASSAMTWSTSFRPLKRWPLFVALVVTTVILDFYASSSPAKTQLLHWNAMGACIDKFGLENLDNMRIPATVAAAVASFVLFLAWLYLFWMSNWGDSSPLVCPCPYVLNLNRYH